MGAHKYCLRCGAELTQSAKFCYRCGAAQPVFDEPDEPAQSVSVAPEEKAELSAGNNTAQVESTATDVRFDTPDAIDLKNVRMPEEAPKPKPHGTSAVPSVIVALIVVAIGAGAWFFLQPDDGASASNAPSASAQTVQSAAPTALSTEASETAQTPGDAPLPGESFISAYARTHDAGQITELTIDCAGSGSVMPYLTSPTLSAQGQPVDFADLAPFTSLRSLTIVNAASVTMPTQPMLPTLDTLNISGSNTDANMAGIENLTGLQRLTVTAASLSDLSEIAKSQSIQNLTLSGNQVTDLYPLQGMTSLRTFAEEGENIWDFRGLKNVASVKIGNANAGPFQLACVERDPGARQVQVLASVLNIRTAPDSHDDSAKTGEHALQNGYYYILDEYWDDANGTTWYKVGSSAGTGYWIAAKEGDWTKLCE